MSRVTPGELGLGSLLAEGGEGRVFEVVRAPSWSWPVDVQRAQPNLVFKQLRHPVSAARLDEVAQFPASLAAIDVARARTVLYSTAWPVAAVGAPGSPLAAGVLMPRAPEQFWLRHREGKARLATLSYLTSDPDRIALAYGVQVPPPGDPERVALVYALCRLVEAWGQGAGSSVVHGDLSAKNVLWSLSPVPSVYVLDCDGATLFRGGLGRGEGPGRGVAPPRGEASGPAQAHGPDELARMEVGAAELGLPPAAPGHDHLAKGPQRAVTPNWDDPAVHPGQAPGPSTDRYSLGLVFLRLVAAGNFPLQSRQRAAPKVNVDLELPRSWRHLPDMPELWTACAASLSLAEPGRRPTPSLWCSRLEVLLGDLGRSDLADAVRKAQGDPRPTGLPGPGEQAADVHDVIVRPVLRRRSASTWQLMRPVSHEPNEPLGGTAGARAGAGAVAAAGASYSAGGYANFAPGPGGVGATGLGGAASPRELVRRTAFTWRAAHRLAVRFLRSPGRRTHGLRRLGGVLAIDIAALCIVLFLVGMIVSPWIGL